MKLVTQNCHGACILDCGKRFETITKKLTEIAPDVAFLQEVISPWQVKLFEITGYKKHFSCGNVINYGGLLTLVKKGIKVNSFGFTRYTSTGKFLSMQLTDKILQKGYQMIKLTNGFHLVKTHILANYNSVFTEDESQLGQIKQFVKEVLSLGNFIAGGDFNIDPGCKYYDILVSKLTDLTNRLDYSDLRNHRKLDYFFSNNVLDIKKVEYIDYGKHSQFFYPSDHRGIYLETY